MFVCGSGADILGSGNVRAADGQMDREDALGATMQESQPTRETGNLDLLGKSFGVRLKFISYPVGTILKSQNYRWGHKSEINTCKAAYADNNDLLS